MNHSSVIHTFLEILNYNVAKHTYVDNCINLEAAYCTTRDSKQMQINANFSKKTKRITV